MQPRRRTEFFVLAGLAVAFPLACWIGSTLVGGGFAYNDFHDYWLAAKLIVQGRSPYDLEALRALATAEGLEFVVGGGYSYPLPFAIVMVPFTAVPFALAVLLFNSISLAAFGGAIAGWITWAHASERVGFGRRALLAFAAGCYPPVVGTVANGQANLVLLAPLAVGTALAVGGSTRVRSFIGGIAIGLAAIVKLIPALLVVPLVLARRAAAVGGVVVGTLGCLVGAAMLVPHGSAGIERLLSLLDPDPYFTNQSINGFVTRLVQTTSRTVAVVPNGFEPRLPVLLLTAAFAVATGFVLWRGRARLGRQRGLALGIALALVAGLIGAPKAAFWTQAFALLGVGLLFAVETPDLRLSRLGRIDLGLVIIWFGGAAIEVALWVAPPPTTIQLAPVVTILTSASLFGMFALWWLLVRRMELVPGPDRPGGTAHHPP